MARNCSLPPTWLRFLIIVLLVVGVFFRFVNLDKKVYSYDEASTSLRISGYTWTEMVHQVFNSQVISVEDLQKYQKPNSEKGVIDTVKGLAVEEPQLTPLYFVMSRWWAQVFGYSPAHTRSFSACLSLIVFPCVYWLCLELFESSLVGWVAIALMAVSPYHVLYAQEARPYMLWAVTILLSSVALLRSRRLKTQINWGFYAATLSLGLYSHLLFWLVAIGHGVYVITLEGFRLSKTLIAYLLASITGLITFVPWMIVIINNSGKFDDTVGLPKISTNPFSSLKPWLLNISHLFIDAAWEGGIIQFSSNLLTNLIRLLLVGMLLILLGYSLYLLCSKTPKQVWLFILTLIGVTGIGLTAIGKTEARYLVPCYLGIQLAIAYLFATQITFNVNIRQQKLWQFVMLAILSLGIVSCAISSQAQLWWNKYPGSTQYNPVVARIINQARQPLVLTDGYVDKTGTMLSLSYLLDPKVRLEVVLRLGKISKIPENFNISDSFSDVFLYKPSKRFIIGLKNLRKYTIKAAYKPGDVWLWRLEKMTVR